jgi:hypothetical protein
LAEYPRLLYRKGSEEEVQGRKCDLLRAESAEHEAEALEDGWETAETFLAQPEPEPVEQPLTILDSPVKDIIAALPQLTRDELEALLADETAGKTRKTLVAALEQAIAAKENV